MWGLTVEEATAPPVEIWPDNLAALNVFSSMVTQWRVGMAGATGLDYSAMESVLRLTGTPRADWPDVFDDVRLMEGAVLARWAAQRDT